MTAPRLPFASTIDRHGEGRLGYVGFRPLGEASSTKDGHAKARRTQPFSKDGRPEARRECVATAVILPYSTSFLRVLIAFA